MTFVESLQYEPHELAFGTSGLRGLVVDMTDLECYINTVGFLRYLHEEFALKRGSQVLLAGDLRDSTPRIMRAVAQAITDEGYRYVNAGLIPTPAAAFAGLTRSMPVIMVTGSHIPADRNGIKFYRADGEVLKSDEQGIQRSVMTVRKQMYESHNSQAVFDTKGQLIKSSGLSPADDTYSREYIERYTSFFDRQALKGKKIVVYQHSAVGRDIIVEVLQSLGAEVEKVGRSDVFVPIDTENVTPDDKKLFVDFAAKYPDCFAIVSTDGDSDRPFVIDESGEFYRGDVLGCIVARYIAADFAAVPISSNDAVDKFCEQHDIELVHTKIGSPYVIVAMQEATKKVLCGWEVNGGFLLGANLRVNDKELSALPTRDALLPILAALINASQKGLSVSGLFQQLPQRYTGGGLIDLDDMDQVVRFKQRLNDDYFDAEQISRLLGIASNSIVAIDKTDGLRINLGSTVLHFRPSGNAPQMRIYTNCDTQSEADDLVQDAVAPGGLIEKILAD